MYHKWLDHWDERRAQQGSDVKEVESFCIGQKLAFPKHIDGNSIQDFCELAETAVKDGSFYNLQKPSLFEFDEKGNVLRFRSEIVTGTSNNNHVYAKITQSRKSDRAIVVFHHWNATNRQKSLASFLARFGFTVVELSMPYHFERCRPGAMHSDYMLSANLGRTLQSVKQAVLDGRAIVHWLGLRGYSQISVLGMSLGSWVAGLVAAHDPAVSKASLFLPADSLADMVWTGRATREIRQSFEGEIEISELCRAWSPVDLGSYAQRLARPGLSLHMVLARRDTVVLPDLSCRLARRLKGEGADLTVTQLTCGHYSMALLPFSALAAISLIRFLLRDQ